MNPKTTGVSVSVYRDSHGDSTRNGVTSPARAEGKIFVVFDEDIVGGNYLLEETVRLGIDSNRTVVTDARDDIVALRIVRRTIGGVLYMHVEPVGRPGNARGMFGGNFVFTSDSRFRRVSDYPLPVHDRFE